MDLPGKWMTICITKPMQSGTHESSKYSLSMVTSKSGRTKVALKKLQDAEMRRYIVLSLPLSFENNGFVRGRELHL